MRIVLTIIWTWWTLYIAAQGSCTFTHYSSENGLSQNTVMNILQDAQGNMWFATWDGLNKFDGYTFKTYKAQLSNRISLTNNRVDFIYEDKYGYIWLLSYDNRVHRFDPRTEQFEPMPLSDDAAEINLTSIQLFDNGVAWLLAEQEGAIRVTTDPKTHKLSAEVYAVKSINESGRHVNKAYLDKEGNEWLLTESGLCLLRKGERDLRTYFGDAKDAKHPLLAQGFNSCMEYNTHLLFASESGRVWVYQKRNSRFELVQLPTKAELVYVHALNDREDIYVTDRDGLFVRNRADGKVEHFTLTGCSDLDTHPIRSAYMDSYATVWLNQQKHGQITYFNAQLRRVEHREIMVEPGAATRGDPEFLIHEDIFKRLWIHPYGGGFSYYDRKEDKLIPFYDQPNAPNWRFSNKIHSAFSDRQGNLWVCTHSKGLEKITFRTTPFQMLSPVPQNYESLSNDVRALFEDDEHNLWVGVKDGLIRVYNDRMEYKGYLTEGGRIAKDGLPMKGVTYAITQDKERVLWIGTKGKGLVRAERQGDHYLLTRYQHRSDDIYSLSNDNIYSIHQDPKGRIWIATYGGGLNYMDQDRNGKIIFINHQNNLKAYPIDLCYKVRFITSDSKGNMWVGTTSGALSFNSSFTNPEDIVFHRHSRISGDVHSLSNNDVHYVLPTRQGETYFATFGGGLNRLISLDATGKARFHSYTRQEGLPSDVLLSMREDLHGHLWISTENGISKFIPQEQRFENYEDERITFPVRFNEAASVKSYEGRLLYGTANGIFYFLPDSTHKSEYVPHVVFSRLVVGNETVIPAPKGLLTRILDETTRLVLSHRENVFTIHYAALDYRDSENIQYAYKLDGFEDEWSYVDKRRTATYTNLPKGHYVFRVKSTNADGVWVENERSLDITVEPSLWETPMAYFGYFLLVILLILITVYILFTIYRLKHEVSVEQQVSDIKLRFFTDISHELRTPLTLIAGPVEYILQNNKFSTEVQEQLLVVQRNTARMLRLVNQILDFRKIQNKKMKMQVRRLNVVPFIHHIMENFETLAQEHRIDFIFETEQEELYLWVDADKLEKIVFNLLSNAFKYTPDHKMITVFIREDEHTVAIGVQDQGIGIAENKKNSIFVRFENMVDKNLFNQSASTGIGLSLVRELVEMHKATISLDSKLGEGSTFKVNFLKGKEHYDEAVEYILDDVEEITSFEKIETFVASETTVKQTLGEAGDTLLIVEDNAELRSFLRSIFSSSFRVVEAVDGLDGWNKALKFLPDFIISDVMMPEKDGIELTRDLKREMTTSHIPIILLTAKSAMESKLEGLELGADDYITKPFSATYLKARVDNLLMQRKKLQNFYVHNIMNIIPKTSEETEETEILQPQLTTYDRKFMDKLVEEMEKNMDNGSLVVDDLVRELAVSRSVFFKKLKMLTGLAPVEFIKEMRMKRAAQLIETGEFNMTQISYMVGINDPRYFSKCFKQKLGMTPTEYKEQKRGV